MIRLTTQHVSYPHETMSLEICHPRFCDTPDYLSTADAKVTVVTKPPDNYAEGDRAKIQKCIDLLIQNGIAVKTKDRIHQKFAIMDQRIIWYGSINLLSYGTSEESIMRIESADIAGELLGSL